MASEEHKDSPWNQRNKTELHFFKFLDNHPRRSTNFALFMQMASKWPQYSPDHLINGYQWGFLGGAKVVDVGGSNGAHAKALSKAFPELTIVVQDLAGVIGETSEGKGRLSGEGRLIFTVHDFFLPQPIRDAEVYLLRWILHDHTDKYAVGILHNIANVMKPSARILVMDRIMPPPTADLTPEVRETRLFDLNMMVLFNGRERSLEDWREVCGRVTPRLKLLSVVCPKGSALSIMELSIEKTQ